MNAVKPANYAKVKVQQLQNVLYLAAKGNPRRRFHALYDKVHRGDILWEAWKRVKSNGGSGGVDGVTIDHIVQVVGEERFVNEIQKMLVDGNYHPMPARRKEIPKADGKMRPLGIPAIRDRVLQMATKTKEQALRAIDVLKAVFGKLELTMNKEKSKLINLWDDKQGFDFLGMHHRKIPKQLKGNKTVSILRSYPSKKAMKSMRQKVKQATEPRNRLYWTMNKMVEELNPKIQGWKTVLEQEA